MLGLDDFRLVFSVSRPGVPFDRLAEADRHVVVGTLGFAAIASTGMRPMPLAGQFD